MAIFKVGEGLSNGDDCKTQLIAAVSAINSSGDDYNTLEYQSGIFNNTNTNNSATQITRGGVTVESSIDAVSTWNGYTNDFTAHTQEEVLSWSVPPQTVIIRPESMTDASLSGKNHLSFIRPNMSSNCEIVVRGIEWRSKLPSLTKAPTIGGGTNDGLSIAEDEGIRFENCKNFKLTNCKFKYHGIADVTNKHNDLLSSAFISNCDFDGGKGADGLGSSYGIVAYGNDLIWLPSSSINWSSEQAMYITRCTFNKKRHSVAAGGMGMYNCNNSYILNNILTAYANGHCMDTHGRRNDGLGSGNNFPTRFISIYKCKIINTLNHNWSAIAPTGDLSNLITTAISLQEAEGNIYNNIISGYKDGVVLSVLDTDLYTPSYPLIYNMGYDSAITTGNPITSTGSNGDGGDSWIWGNTFNAYEGGNDWTGEAKCKSLRNLENGIYNKGNFPYDQNIHWYKLDREWHETARPGYVELTSHSLDTAPPITPTGIPFRTYKSRTFKSR